MKYPITIIFTLLFFVAYGQSIKEIKIWSSHLDALPTVAKEVPEGQITFLINSSGDFVATFYYVNKKKKKLKEPIIIENERVKTFETWLTGSKKEFKLKEIGIDSLTLKREIASSQNFTFEVEENIVIKIDTFNFCNQKKIKERRSVHERDFRKEFKFIDTLGVEKSFIFDNNNISDKLDQYILLYTLFSNKLSEEIPPFGTFREGFMLYLIKTYLQTIECEEYYYQEYLRKHPEKTAAERRMRTGWNFKEYMTNEKGWRR